ncbi:MAG: class I SAM-dependent methyltransferase [Thermoleophilaceae bacterium]
MTESDLTAQKARTQHVWSLGDYSYIAQNVTGPAAQPLVDACAISAGQEILDVAAGSGNVAIVAAREGASVVASDLTPHMLAAGRARTQAEGLAIEWVEADAEALPFADESFDCVVSAFGAMTAPRPEVVARELFRVVRSGGTVGMANWTSESFIARQSALLARHLPPPPGTPVPSDWGDPAIVAERFGNLAKSITTEPGEVVLSGASPENLAAAMQASAGPWVAARDALGPERYAQVERELVELVRKQAIGDGPVELRGEYLLVVARKRG